MGDAIAVALILATGATFLALGWAMLYAATRQGRSPADPDKESPPWPECEHHKCPHCGWAWFRLRDDARPCPNCDDTGTAQP